MAAMHQINFKWPNKNQSSTLNNIKMNRLSFGLEEKADAQEKNHPRGHSSPTCELGKIFPMQCRAVFIIVCVPHQPLKEYSQEYPAHQNHDPISLLPTFQSSQLPELLSPLDRCCPVILDLIEMYNISGDDSFNPACCKIQILKIIWDV
eukprot:scaffold54759_cov49-Attheya_sp.AAC.1